LVRGELDDALARIARREELERRLATEQAAGGQRPLDELIEAVRRVVAQHPTLTVQLWADDGTATSSVRVAWSDGTVAVGPEGEPVAPDGAVAPSWPRPVYPAPGSTTAPGGVDAPAARLAELIRQDPSLLDGIDRAGT
jgi:hypothetical protein